MYLDGRCWGITSPNVAHVVRTDSNGVASWQVAPETLIGASPMSFQAAASGPNGVRLSYPLTVKVFHTAPTEVCEDIAPTMSRDADDMGCVRCSVAGPGT
jgi:hypothetical protein